MKSLVSSFKLFFIWENRLVYSTFSLGGSRFGDFDFEGEGMDLVKAVSFTHFIFYFSWPMVSICTFDGK